MKPDFRKTAAAMAVILGILFGSVWIASGAMPGYQNVYGPLVTPEQADSVLIRSEPVTKSTTGIRETAWISEEIKSLVRGLKNDPDLIYAYVHDHIRYAPLFGDVKGAAATLTDRSGNDVDQAGLMIAMLRQAGFEASYVYGQIRLYPEQVHGWLGTNHPGRLGTLLPSAGIPVDIYAYSADDLAYIDISHVWVKAVINDTEYMFDPSFKQHAFQNGIDIADVSGFNRSSFVTDALSGATAGADWIQNVSRDTIRNQLSTMAMNLVDHVRTHMPDAALEEIIGGGTIIKNMGVLRQTSLPYQIAVTQEWTQVPDTFRKTLRIELPGIDQTLYSSDIYGRRLTLFYNTANQPELRLDGTLLATGSAVSPGINQVINIHVDHPYAGSGGTYADVSGTINIRAGGSYIIVNGWGEISRNMVDKHAGILGKNHYSGQPTDSEPVLGQSLAVLSYQWLAECSRMDELTEQLTGTSIIHHHWIGVSGQNESPYIDMPINLQSVVSLDNDIDLQRAVFISSSGHHSAFEWGVIEQTQPPYSAVSTVKLLDFANQKSDKIFDADSGNFNSIKTILKSGTYSSSELNHIQAYINAGYRVILPEDGNLGEGDWEGMGFLAIHPASGSVGHIISGGLKGGFGTDYWILTPDGMMNVNYTGSNSDAHEQSPEPIDLVTGNYLYDHTDLRIGSNPPPLGLAFSRSYNSGDSLLQQGMGLGWSHNFNIRARQMSSSFQAMGEDSFVDAAAAIVQIMAAASVLHESNSKENLVIATVSHRWAMDMQIDNLVLVTRPGESRQFTKLPDGSYNGPPDSAAQLTFFLDNSIQLMEKDVTVLLFQADGTIESIHDANDNPIFFQYSDGRLAQVNTGTGSGFSFTYENNRLTRVEDTAFRAVTYDYDDAGNLITFTDAAGEDTMFDYVTDGMLSSIYYPTDPVNPFVLNQYDTTGKISFQTDAENNRYAYYFAGFRAEEENPLGNTKIWEFDGGGRTVLSANELQSTTRRIYDGLGRIMRIIYPLRNEIRFEYDGQHNIIRTTIVPVPGSGEPSVDNLFTYTPVFSRVQSHTDPLGRVTDYDYDDKGNLTRILLPTVDSLRPRIDYTYNERGQVLTITDPEGKITLYDYDLLTGDLVQVTDDFTGQDIQIAYAYDAAGNRTASTDPNGNTTSFFHDDLGRITASVSASPHDYETRFFYDKTGNLTRVSRQDNTSADQWQTYVTTYTPLFKPLKESDPENDTTWYEYDALGRTWRITDPEDHAMELVYDDAGRLIQKKDTNGTLIVSYAYNANGRLTGITDGNLNTTTFIYDGLGRLITTLYPDTTTEEYTYDAAGHSLNKKTRSGGTISYEYDPLNRLISKTTPEKNTVYEYDQVGRLISAADETLTLSYLYDTAGRLESVTRSDGKTIDKSYDAAGNLVQLTYPDGYCLTYTYDGLNRLEQILESGNTTLAVYTYDSLSRRTSVTLGNGTSTAYLYEPDNDISTLGHQFNGKDVTFDYTYNRNGNRISFGATDDRFLYQPLANDIKIYTSNLLNQYTAVNSDPMDYDLNGNLVSAGLNTFAYDPENRLKQAVTQHAVAVYASDPLGRRHSKTINSESTGYVYADDHVIIEYDAADTLVKRFIYGPLIDEPVCMITPQDRYYFHADSQGSIVAVTNDTGTLAQTYAYSPFGKINAADTLDNPYLYTGRRLDSESGRYHYRARQYDADAGRFMQPDPISFAGGINLYAYCQNNPVNLVDPDGEFPILITAGVAVVVMHYGRNLFNDDISYTDAKKMWEKLPADKAVYHQMGQGNENNEKYISTDGRSEAVFTSEGKLVLNSANMGTYNYFSPNALWGMPHGITDVIPYLLLGNTPGDLINPDRFVTTWEVFSGSSK